MGNFLARATEPAAEQNWGRVGAGFLVQWGSHGGVRAWNFSSDSGKGGSEEGSLEAEIVVFGRERWEGQWRGLCV